MHTNADNRPFIRDTGVSLVRASISNLRPSLFASINLICVHPSTRGSNCYFGEIFVPTFSPWITRAMFPGTFILKTTSGILRSIARVIAVRSITRS